MSALCRLSCYYLVSDIVIALNLHENTEISSLWLHLPITETTTIEERDVVLSWFADVCSKIRTNHLKLTLLIPQSEKEIVARFFSIVSDLKTEWGVKEIDLELSSDLRSLTERYNYGQCWAERFYGS